MLSVFEHAPDNARLKAKEVLRLCCTSNFVQFNFLKINTIHVFLSSILLLVPSFLANNARGINTQKVYFSY